MDTQDTQPPKSRKHIPWWVYLFLAIFFYTGCKYILPGLASDPTSQAQLSETGNLAAPIIAIVFLLLAANGLFKDVPPPKSREEPPPAEEDESEKFE